MIAALLISAALAVELPDRPKQSVNLEPGACPETAIIDGRPSPPLPSGCIGLVLPLAVWADLEALASDSRMVRDLWRLQAAEHAFALQMVEAKLEAATAPIPWHQRPGLRGFLIAAGTVAAVVAYETASRELAR